MRPHDAVRLLAVPLLVALLAGLATVPATATTPSYAGPAARPPIAQQLVLGHHLQRTRNTVHERTLTRAARKRSGHALRIATFNLRAGMGIKKFKRGVRAVRRHAGVVGLQEIGKARRHRWLRASRTWGHFHPSYIRQNPVIWNKNRFRKVAARGQRIAKSRWLLGQLPGHRRQDGKRKHSTATVVRLRDKATGRRLSVVNVHLVHGAVKGGKPWPRRPRVFNLYRDQMRGVVRTVRKERRWGRVFVVGDFNAGYRADRHHALPRLPYRSFKRVRMNSMWQGTRYLRHDRGTRNDALIDQVWSKRLPRRARVLRGVRPSDHFPAVATYRLRKAHHRLRG